MTPVRAALTLALAMFFGLGGVYFVRLGVRRGLIEKRIEQLGHVHTGAMAVMIGVYSVVLGVGSLVACAVIAWKGWHGTLKW